MNIVHHSIVKDNLPVFGGLAVGITFTAKNPVADQVYMKVNSTVEGNAISLKTGDTYHFNSGTAVRPVECEVHVYPK